MHIPEVDLVRGPVESAFVRRPLYLALDLRPLDSGRRRPRKLSIKAAPTFLIRRGPAGADFAGEPARFFFERAESELSAVAAIAEILIDPGFEAAAAFALRDVHEIVDEQFAIAPGIGPNDHGMAKAYATSVVREDAGATRGLSQLGTVGQGNTIHHQ